MCLDEESGGGKEEQEQLDGMKFLGERDMKSLHKVITYSSTCSVRSLIIKSLHQVIVNIWPYIIKRSLHKVIINLGDSKPCTSPLTMVSLFLIILNHGKIITSSWSRQNVNINMTPTHKVKTGLYQLDFLNKVISNLKFKKGDQWASCIRSLSTLESRLKAIINSCKRPIDSAYGDPWTRL